ncbi:MAG: porin [Burkholderiales bacterium]|nr:porin [Burkholderiales bacterium]
MKYPRLGSLVLLSLAATAHAQVTLTGGVDGNITRVRAAGAGKVWQLRDGGMYVTKLTFSGREDMGGGYASAFYFETQAGSDTGDGVPTNSTNLFSGSSGAGLSFNRKATLSLFTPAGELRLGRDYTPTFAAPAYFDPFFSAGVGSAVNFQPYYKFIASTRRTLAPGTNVRASNAIAYHTAGLGMREVDLYYQQAFSENVGPEYKAIGIHYHSGPLLVAAGLSRSEGPFVDGAAYLTPATASRDNVLTVWSAGAWYKFKKGFTLMGFYHSQRLDAFGETGSPFGTERDRKVDDWMAGFSWAIDVSTIKFAVMKRNDKGRANADSTQVGLGYSYHLSKRTALYANYVSIRNENSANYNFIAAALPPVAGGKASAHQIGLSHNF